MKKDILLRLDNLLFFTKESLKQWEKDEDVLNFNIKYWLKKELIMRVKNGLYILKSRFDAEKDKDLYLEYLANKIYEPSYLSCEYVMNKYNLLTEAVYGLTSVTTKKTTNFVNKLGRFSYYSLAPRLFFGFELKNFFSAKILIAKKSKAVFDYLYLRFLRKTPINDKSIEELRINWENLTKKEFKEIIEYAKISKNKRILKVFSLIKKKYYA